MKFGAKLDLSIDENGMARLERLSFNAYNEFEVLIGAIERYKERIGHYPQRVLADKTYRNRRIFRSAGCMASSYPDRRWEDRERMR